MGTLLSKLSRPAIVRWLLVGLVFYLAGLGLLYAFIGRLHVPLLLGTLLVAELTTVLRYLINDRWVFKQTQLSWTRLWQFHLANIGGFATWWIVVNLLPRVGVHYLVASTVGTACSMLSTMATNFLWVWRPRKDSPPLHDLPAETLGAATSADKRQS
jgi:putative flippase GtrA